MNKSSDIKIFLQHLFSLVLVTANYFVYGQYCPPLRPPPYGYLVRPCGTGAGDNCNIDCDVGFDIIGPSYRLCRRNGSWSGYDTQCVKPSIQCPLVRASSANLRVRGCQNIAGGVCQFDCNYGWTLQGRKTIYCRIDGQWSDKVPSCGGDSCPSPPPPPANGMLVAECSREIGSYCSYRCLSGYALVGNPTIQCNNNGQWSAEAPTCERLQRFSSCPPLFPPENGSISGKCGPVIATDEDCKFFCDSGHKLNGQETLTCRSNGQWSSDAPTCSKSECPAINPPNKTFTAGQCNPGLAGNSCMIYCSSESGTYRVHSLKCNQDGHWSGSVPSCNSNSHCPSLIAPINGFATGQCSPGINGQYCHFTCASGFILVGSRSTQCMNDGQWSSQSPMCTRSTSSSSNIFAVSSSHSCPDLTAPIGGFYKSNFNCPKCPNTCPGYPNQACYLYCGRGYRMSGSGAATYCNPSTFKWEPQPATCVGEGLFLV